ncbi:HlyD family efflux transporter periplasmic adaptor subunit [Luteimonas sp. XNQY3]|nr:HlyD family efflux transporter periplasmic adaptor subunit [Luteimonas sp. XNQY3]MCD9005845.1 HlyD family efflux transporter periplasmic adaptor subunit [Luteimonas sp. XNQY3]
MDIAKSSRTPLWRRRNLQWSALGVAALALLVGVGLGIGRAAPGVSRSELWIDTVVQGDMHREIRATGTLVPRQIRWISAGATATVQELVVLAGARVEADTVILRLANPELQSALDKAEAALAGAEADVAAVRTQLASQLLEQQAQEAAASSAWRIAQVKRDAFERAHAAGVMSAIDLREAQITEAQGQGKARIEHSRVAAFRQNMAAQLQAARARRDEAASAVAIARQQVQGLEVRAGIDGILQQIEVEPGQQVEAGGKLARVARPDELIARLQVPEVLAKDLVLDLPVSVDTRSGVAKGRLARIDPAVREGSVTVDIAFDSALPAGVRPDLSVDGRVLLGTVRDTMSIGRPASAAPDSRGTLFVIPAGGSDARRRPVEFGAVSSDRIEVRSGLQPGDTVILSDTDRWRDHDTLRIQ